MGLPHMQTSISPMGQLCKCSQGNCPEEWTVDTVVWSFAKQVSEMRQSLWAVGSGNENSFLTPSPRTVG